MKNIHLIPTYKPSRLFLNQVNNKLLLEDISNPGLKNVLPSGSYQNIYITSDEEIKFNDYVIQVNFEKTNAQVIRCTTEFQVKIANDEDGSFTKKKIILTTDQDLIKDGVQAIDDEFLEWFIKNPSCEEIELEEIEKYKSTTYDQPDRFIGYDYKIIIPKEEPKQETMKYEHIIVNKSSILKKIERLEKEREEAALAKNEHAVGNFTGQIYALYELVSNSYKSTPLIPEIEKAFDAGEKYGFYEAHNANSGDIPDNNTYLSNLKLDI